MLTTPLFNHNSPDFQRKIFERTENAKGVKFDPQFIHVEWKQRAAPMAPLFSPISSQGDVGQSQDVNFEGQVKATPNMANFTLTQTTESRDHPVSTLSLFDFAQPSSLMFSRGLDCKQFLHRQSDGKKTKTKTPQNHKPTINSPGGFQRIRVQDGSHIKVLAPPPKIFEGKCRRGPSPAAQAG